MSFASLKDLKLQDIHSFSLWCVSLCILVSDSDDELFDEIAVAPQRKKLLTSEKAEPQCCEMPAPPVGLRDFLPEPRPSVPSTNYADCTESNDDDDDDDEGDEATNNGEQVVQTPKQEAADSQSSGDAPTATPSASSIPPKWDAFFKPASLPTDESSEPDNSQNSLARSSERTCSQSPVLFGEDEDDSDSFHLSSSQSTHISDNGVENFSEMDTVLLRPETKKADCQQSKTSTTNVESGVVAQSHLNDSQNSQSDAEKDTEQKPDSQESSDFELPPTPGSTAPRAEELRELYQKLAAGEELFLRRGSKGSV